MLTLLLVYERNTDRISSLTMIALAGMIGTGLFLSSGKALAQAGPLGCVLGFVMVTPCELDASATDPVSSLLRWARSPRPSVRPLSSSASSYGW